MSAGVAHLGEARCARRSSSPAKLAFAAPIKATMGDLKHAVRWREDTPGDVPPDRLREIVGVTALHLGLCALNSGVELDLGNGYVLCCSVRQVEAPCAG